MTEPGWPDQPELGAEDDQWHVATEHWWEMETNWWGFYVPERKLAGALYTQVLVNQRLCNGGAWIWDGSEKGSLYESYHRGLPFPELGDLNDVTFPNGVSVKTLEPLMKYRTIFLDPGKLEIDVLHEGTIRPRSHPRGAWPYWNTGHFDQPMHSTGAIRLFGETIEIDCYSERDRSWGPRPSGPTPPEKKVPFRPPVDIPRPARAAYPHSVAYQFGNHDANEGFLVFTTPLVDEDGIATDDVTAGYLIRDGEYAPLVSGHRELELVPGTRCVDRTHIEATDVLGRRLVADGKLVARWGEGAMDGVGMFEYTWDDRCHGWGEDQTFAPPGWLEQLDKGPGGAAAAR